MRTASVLGFTFTKEVFKTMKGISASVRQRRKSKQIITEPFEEPIDSFKVTLSSCVHTMHSSIKKQEVMESFAFTAKMNSISNEIMQKFQQVVLLFTGIT